VFDRKENRSPSPESGKTTVLTGICLEGKTNDANT
jgi:hypothetical protein